jgi:uncharacterized repeat protein (TIGR03943 family)
MTASFRTLRDFVLLLLWGTFVLWMDLSKQLSTYLHPSLQPYTVGAGVLLIILAIFSLRSLLKGTGAPHECCHHDHSCSEHDHPHSHHEHHDNCAHDDHESHHGHDHSASEKHEHDDHHGEHDHEKEHHHHHGEAAGGFSLLFKTLVLLLPLAGVVLGQSNHYTMSTIANRGVVQDLSKLPSAKGAPLTAVPSASPESATSSNSPSDEGTSASGAGAMPIQVIDMLYAVQMPTYREEFDGKQVELVGQFVPLTTGNPKGDRFQAIRLFITCCAADAKPVGVTIQYDKPLKVSEMGWVKVTGTPTFPMEGGRRTAVLVANKVEECAAPDEPFVY